MRAEANVARSSDALPLAATSVSEIRGTIAPLPRWNVTFVLCAVELESPAKQFGGGPELPPEPVDPDALSQPGGRSFVVSSRAFSVEDGVPVAGVGGHNMRTAPRHANRTKDLFKYFPLYH